MTLVAITSALVKILRITSHQHRPGFENCHRSDAIILVSYHQPRNHYGRESWSSTEQSVAQYVVSHDGSAQQGFSLIEMIVSLTIVFLLLALTLAALSSGRRKADTTLCINNARSVVQAWHLYAADAEDRLVINVDGLFGGRTNWIAGNSADPLEATNRSLLSNPARSLLSTYVGRPEVFKCPADENIFYRSISMNCRLNPYREYALIPRWIAGGGADFRVFRSMTDLGRPSDVFVSVDESARSINDAYFAVDLSNTGSPDGVGRQIPLFIIDIPAVVHDEGTIFSFADGSSKRIRWSNPSVWRNSKPRTRVPQTERDVEILQSKSSYR
jgi:prepilin-type N-terminal cleavage/methylation domain-containing protein